MLVASLALPSLLLLAIRSFTPAPLLCDPTDPRLRPSASPPVFPLPPSPVPSLLPSPRLLRPGLCAVLSCVYARTTSRAARRETTCVVPGSGSGAGPSAAGAACYIRRVPGRAGSPVAASLSLGRRQSPGQGRLQPEHGGRPGRLPGSPDRMQPVPGARCCRVRAALTEGRCDILKSAPRGYRAEWRHQRRVITVLSAALLERAVPCYSEENGR